MSYLGAIADGFKILSYGLTVTLAPDGSAFSFLDVDPSDLEDLKLTHWDPLYSRVRDLGYLVTLQRHHQQHAGDSRRGGEGLSPKDLRALEDDLSTLMSKHIHKLNLNSHQPEQDDNKVRIHFEVFSHARFSALYKNSADSRRLPNGRILGQWENLAHASQEKEPTATAGTLDERDIGTCVSDTEEHWVYISKQGRITYPIGPTIYMSTSISEKRDTAKVFIFAQGERGRVDHFNEWLASNTRGEGLDISSKIEAFMFDGAANGSSRQQSAEQVLRRLTREHRTAREHEASMGFHHIDEESMVRMIPSFKYVVLREKEAMLDPRDSVNLRDLTCNVYGDTIWASRLLRKAEDLISFDT